MDPRERKRNSYSRVDEAKMWMFLYRKLREASPAAREPKGLRIWSEYINECQVSRTVDSLTTRFRRHMIGNLHNADLSCDVMMFLYRQLRINMDPDVKIMLQLKFSIEIVLNENGYVKTYKKSVQPVLERHLPTATKREHQPEAGLSRKKSAPSNSYAQRESDVLSDEGSLTPPPRKRSSLDFTRQIHDVLVDSRFETRYKRHPEKVEVIHDEDFDTDEEDSFNTQSSHGSTAGPSKITDQPSSSKQQNLVSQFHHYANFVMHPSSSNPDQNALREPQMAESPNKVPDSCAKETVTNASQDQFSSSGDEPENSNEIQVVNVPEEIPNADEADVATNSAGNGLQMTPQLGTIVVSETSDTCEMAYQRLYNALNNSSNVPVDNYEKSLCALDYQLEKLIQDVKQRCEPSVPRPISSVVTIEATSNAPISVTLAHTDSSKVPLTLRKQKVKEVFPPFDPEHYSFAIEEIVDRLERLESLAAQMPENYEHNMLKVKEAVKERINQIRLQRNRPI
ncbi:unnamed protein product [Haemonchus placei]|uniref:SPK domain-containing protein n=1 Tax=Haemonchus placei TaxID=6290 RepID=A0A0N4WBU1_HAEPC|nr:unnamed protein product [Haemonchus placei]